jgi:regulator of sigma E protease
MSWALTVAGLAMLIILHEFGHFSVAKAVGMRVERFSLFFPPTLAKVRRGETEYAIGAIPLGGYVKITGMNPQEQVPPEVAPRSYFRQPVWKRVVVIAAGPTMNVLLAFVILWGVFLVKGNPNTTATNTIGIVESHQPASGVLRVGDQLVAVDGRTGPLTALTQQIASHHCPGTPTPGCAASTPVRLAVRRHGRLLNISLVPRYDSRVKRTRVGFGFQDKTVFHSVGPGRAISLSADRLWSVTEQTVTGIVKVFYNSQARSQVHGIVGISTVASQQFHYGVVEALYFLAIISMLLAVVNLFPFLPLDGGHIFWALAEKVRRRPISYAVMQQASVVGILLIAFLAITGLTNDINTLQTGGFGRTR